MRLLVVILTFLLFVGIIGLVLTNLDTRVALTFWKTEYHDLPLFLIMILAVFAGVVYAGVIGVAEGASIRIANRKLQREVQRLETELNHARTQPPTHVDAEALAAPRRHEEEPAATGAKPAAAPVYSAEEEWRPDDEDDVYTGGRAV